MGQRGKFALIGLVAFVAGWLVLSAVAADNAPGKSAGGKDVTQKTQAASVRVAPVEAQSIAPELTAVGNVIPYETVAVTARINSQIAEVKFKAGDYVEKGAPLFVLDSREIQAGLNQAKAKLAGDQSQLETLKKEYDRAELGVTQGFSSQSVRDLARAAYDQAQSNIRMSAAQVDSLKVQLSYTLITAPISGRTGTVNYTQGNVVPANSTVPLVTINQIRPISVQAALPQTSIDGVRAALAQGPVTVEATTNTGKKVSGTLEYIENTIDTATGTYNTRSTFANDDETLWPGTLANVRLSLGQGQETLTVPEVAIQHSQTGDFVYVIDGEDTAHKRDVKVARIQEGKALIAEGLKAGERVATDGMMAIKDGGPVTINDGAKPEMQK